MMMMIMMMMMIIIIIIITKRKCRICEQKDETTDPITSACPVLAQEKYVESVCSTTL